MNRVCRGCDRTGRRRCAGGLLGEICLVRLSRIRELAVGIDDWRTGIAVTVARRRRRRNHPGRASRTPEFCVGMRLREPASDAFLAEVLAAASDY